MNKIKNSKNLKIFFIKLVSIVVAVIIIFNVLFNLLISNSKYLNALLSLSELENRRALANNFRDEIGELLEKDNIIKKKDKILLYKLYEKIRLEFKDIELEK